MHIVLDAIHHHWTRKKLSLVHRQDLYYLADASEEPLKRLDELLRTHGGLGEGKRSFRDRMRWVGKSLVDAIKPIQAELDKKSERMFRFHAVISD